MNFLTKKRISNQSKFDIEKLDPSSPPPLLKITKSQRGKAREIEFIL